MMRNERLQTAAVTMKLSRGLRLRRNAAMAAATLAVPERGQTRR